LDGPVAEEELDAIAEMYRSRGLPLRVRLSPLADPAAVALLGTRGCVVRDFMNVYARELPPLAGAPSVPGVKIRVATEAEARLWFTRNGAEGDWAEPDGVSFMTVRCTLKEGARLFVAWVGDEPAAAGGLEVHDGVAALMAAATLPAYRGRGIHRALLDARLAAAVADGCDLAMVHTSPGTPSQRNVLRAGFALMYTAPTVIRVA
jgi:GNAT superfamily N-acetyltransferase